MSFLIHGVPLTRPPRIIALVLNGQFVAAATFTRASSATYWGT